MLQLCLRMRYITWVSEVSGATDWVLGVSRATQRFLALEDIITDIFARPSNRTIGAAAAPLWSSTLPRNLAGSNSFALVIGPVVLSIR